jgi:gliding motility-associated-like protein
MSYASHVVGGNIEVEQTGANSFTITASVFRDCDGAIDPDGDITIYEQGTNNFVMSTTLPFIDSMVVALGDSCYTPTGLCVENWTYEGSVTLANNSNGYYVVWGVCCRNAGIDNINTPSSEGSLFYTEFPDPALAGMNSTPQFGPFPADGYFCVNYTLDIPSTVVDPDGDSLVFSLVTPYNDDNMTQPFSNVAWAGGFSAANIVGNTIQPPMTIDSETGMITVHPEMAGVFVFSILVEEYRNGTKIGETLRDVQYEALACSFDDPPTINMQDTVAVYAGDSICVDVTVTDADGTDTLFVLPTSNDFDLVATFVYPDQVGSTWEYSNFNNSGSPVSMDHFEVFNIHEFEGVGEMYLRYCWQPECESVDQTFEINLLAYSFGCSGSDTSQRPVYFDVQYEPAEVTLSIPDSITVTYDEEICFEVLTVDDLFTGYPLGLTPVGSGFDYIGNYVAPSQNSQGHYYTNFSGLDTVYIRDYSYNNGEVIGKDTVAIRYCWTPGCGDVFLSEYDLQYEASLYAECFVVSESKIMQVNVEPPSSELTRVPNVFTPNGDGDNDYFKLGGSPDPCFDSISVDIYNRWGKIVYSSEDPYFEWDGTMKGKGNADCAAGTYYVIIGGSYGSTYDPVTGEAIPTAIEEKYTIQLLR